MKLTGTADDRVGVLDALRGTSALLVLAAEHPVVVLGGATMAAVGARAIWFASDPEVALRALVLAALACGLILAVLVRRPTQGRVTRILAGVGVASYGLYLWHGVLVTAATVHPALFPIRHPGVLGYLVHLGILLGASLALAIASWRLLEKPIIDWARGSSIRSRPSRSQLNRERDVSVAAPVPLGLGQSARSHVR